DLVSDKSQVEYTFDKAGKYNIKLRMRSIAGTVTYQSASIEVFGGSGNQNALTPDIKILPNLKTYVAPLTLRFSAEDSSAPNKDISSYEWDFGEGKFSELGKQVDHFFLKKGEYIVKLTIKTKSGQKAEKSEKIIISDPLSAPKAIIRTNPVELNGTAPFQVSFDGTGSQDQDNNIVEYQWDLDGNGDFETIKTKPEYTFRDPGKYTISLKVVDADQQSDQTSIEIQVQDPTTQAKFTMTPQSGSVPLTVLFDASSSSSNKSKIISYEWDFGDGSKSLSGAQQKHRYLKEGSYEVKLKVFAEDGNTAETKNTVYARSASIQACFSASRHSGSAPLVVSFDSSCSSGNINEWKWDFGDKSFSNERKPQHVFNNSGKYAIKLEILDANNNVSDYHDEIEV
ncbi:MAG TPA: PKD domain-containing protein, partial [Candidatus Gracilibacteria bacterium]|nr:PKD domain-containing protein [Candidatus Gracilibacteria bacterium]